jgi:hypothetical protein
VRDAAQRAQIWANGHARHDEIGFDKGELDAEQLREGQRVRVDAFQERHDVLSWNLASITWFRDGR